MTGILFIQSIAITVWVMLVGAIIVSII